MRGNAVLLLAVACVYGQQPAAPARESPEPGSVFTVTSTLIQVDAEVTDSKGRHVTDLTADDFQIFEDGKLQKLTHFAYVEVTPESKGAKAKPERKDKLALPPPPLAQLRPEDVRRTIVLMVDDLGLSFESMVYVRGALRKFVNEQMQPGDLVSICRTGSGSSALQQFTGDKRLLLAVIDGLGWNPNGRFGTGYFDPYGKYSAAAEALAGSTHNGAASSREVSYDVQQNAKSTVGTLGALNYIVGALREIPGRKSIVLFSDGFELTGGKDEPSVYDEAARALDHLIDRANRAGAVIYTMHASGLQTVGLDAQDNLHLNGMGPKGVIETLNESTQPGQPGGRDVLNNMRQQNLMKLAEMTGGFAYYNGNDMNWGLDRVMEDQRGYYLLGYHPSETTVGGKNHARDFHKVHVKVTRPGLHVRSRTGFFGETDSEALPKYSTPLDQLRNTMLSPFQSSAVGVRLTALYAEVPKKGPVVRNLLRISTKDLVWEHEAAGGDKARVFVVAIATGAGGQALATEGRMFNLQVAADKMSDAQRDGALYMLDVAVPKRGAYQIRVAVRDEATGKFGSASQFIEIPELKKAGFALASIVLQDAAGSAARGLAGITPAMRQFKSGSSFEFLAPVENGRKKGPPVDLVASVRILRDGREVYSGPAQLVDVEGGGLAIFGALKLSGSMTPGDYYLQVVARESGGKKMLGQWTDFVVVP